MYICNKWYVLYVLINCQLTCKPAGSQLCIKLVSLHAYEGVQGTGVSPTETDPENKVGDQDTRSPDSQFLLGCNCPVCRGIIVQEQDILGEIPAAFFFQNVLQLHQ
jgi:hypothetical protein